MPIGREPVHTGVALPVRDVQVPGWPHDHLSGMIKGPGSSGDQVPVNFCSRVRVHVSCTKSQKVLTLQGVFMGHRRVTVANVGGVVSDEKTVWAAKLSAAPRADVLPRGIKGKYRGVTPLKHVHSEVRVGGHGTGDAEGHPLGQLGPVLDQSVPVSACSDGFHPTS